MLKDYLKEISNTLAHGDAREESFYGDLKNLLREFAETDKKKNIDITVLPKKTEAGNPDFRVWDGTQHIVGYVEAKAPEANLDVTENSEQLKRYRKTFPNLILTNFYEFRLYRKGDLIDKVHIARSFISKKLKTIPPVENEEKFLSLLGKFYSFSLPKVFTAEKLAIELAKRTRFLRDEIIAVELEEERKGKGKLFGFYEAFKKYLIANLKEKDFADLFSQTITYGLFAARTRSINGFNRKLAFDYIPKTIGILREVFQFISLGNLPKQMEVIVDDIAEVLNVADVKNILSQYYKAGKGEDPVVHFYETFLNEYDPAMREKRGVYYTPEPVVRYIVRSVHELLKTHFDLQDGLASREVTLLDPAGGTLTFPAEAIKLAVKEFTDKYGEGGLNKFISNHVLKNFYAFELMMAPYAIGHIKIGFLLDELGYKMKEEERFKLYLTNTLDMEDLSQTQIPGLESLSEESHLAGNVKKKEPILVIMGNPPYSGISANMNKWAKNLLKEIDGAQSYYEVDGNPLGEKKLWLQDDYVKFLRFAQWKIHKAEQGIVGMITNHSYLDNPTFRGMRQSLMNTFNEIYIIDLHGNGLKKETTPDGSKDGNVFDIQQGVCIAIFIKEKNKKGNKIYHTGLFGVREKKYKWMEKTTFKKKTYKVLKPQSPWYFFKQYDIAKIKHYNDWKSLQEIFTQSTVGFVTGRDKLTIQFSEQDVWATINNFIRLDVESARQAYDLGEDSRDWKVSFAQKDIKDSVPTRDLIHKVSYRPFDTRFTYYTGKSRGFYSSPQFNIMQHILKKNVGLCIGRQGQVVGDDQLWNLAFISDAIIDFNIFYRGGELFFPLYLYPSKEKNKNRVLQSMVLFEPEVEYRKKDKVPNIAQVIFEMLESVYKKKPSSEEIFHYIYAVLYSNIYREKYAEFLKIDFPRIPFTSDYKVFSAMSELGEELIQLHLLESKAISKPISKCLPQQGSDKIEKIVYDEKEKRVYFNDEKYFTNVTPEIWNYQIGGYQVLEKYLKDRKGRQMDTHEHYSQTVTAISKTIELQKKIDSLFPKVEKEIISFNK